MEQRWKLTLEYEGTGFSGWQQQPNARTVEGELEDALASLFGCRVDVTGQGRTDQGVHAERQTAHVDLPEPIRADRLLAAMRGLLPSDLALIAAEQVQESFHARFDALSRRYRYQVATRHSPLHRNHCWTFLHEFDPEQLYKCAEMIVGEHDFINFAKMDSAEKKSGICVINRSEWVRQGALWYYRISGNRFLRHMVRRLVGTMLLTASGRLECDRFAGLLDGEERRWKGHSAPSSGLFLEGVDYD